MTLEQKKQWLKSLTEEQHCCTQLASDLLLALEALEFYADGHHYANKDYDIHMDGNVEDHIIGKRARTTLNKIIERE